MDKIMNLREGILNALVDDGESIIQIELSLNNFKISFTRELVKKNLISLINEGLLEIAYPPKKKVNDFIKTNDESIENFWFELTKKGYEEWQKIDF